MNSSVVMTTFNGERWVGEQLSSILDQTCPAREVIICDDGSLDRTVEIVSTMISKPATTVGVRIDRHENIGLNSNLERGLRAARFPIIVLADQDDIWFREKLEVIESTFEQHPDATALFTDGTVIDDDGRSIDRSLWRRAGLSRTEMRELRKGNAFKILLRWNFTTGATMAFRRTLLDTILPLPAAGMHDAWIALLAASQETLLPVEHQLIRYRLHQSNTTGLPAQTPLGRLRHRRRVDPRPTEADLYAAVEARLRSVGSAEEVRRALEEKVEFTNVRGNLPDRIPERFAVALRLLLAGDYRRFSKRWPRSLAYDLLFGGRL